MVRCLNASDLKSVNALRHEIHLLHVNARPDIYRVPDWNSFDAGLTDLLQNSNYQCYVCVHQAVITGYALVRLASVQNLLVLNERTIMFVEEFCISEKYHRKGYGTELMKELVKQAKCLNADSLELDVWQFNEKAICFYQSLGLAPKRQFLEMKLKGE